MVYPRETQEMVFDAHARAFAFFAAYDRELPWIGRDPTIDQTFIRHMLTHHEQGILLARLPRRRPATPIFAPSRSL